jgi:hypothetical protein
MKFLRIALVVILFSLNSIFLFAIFQTQVQAQIVCNPADRNQGLVSSVGLNGTFGNPTGQCVIDQKAAYVNFKVPNYNELKSVFFTQNSSSIKTVIDSISTPGCTGGNTVYLKNLAPTGRTIFNVQCNFTHIADTDPTYGPLMTTGTQQTIVIFADNHLYIDTNLDYGGDQYGLVIVAKGDIYIAPTVTKINAVLVNEGNVVTSYTGGSISDLVANSQQLVINGSLINLSQSGQRIYFNRSLTDNNIPAEVVNFQPKFLVLLRGMMTQSYTIQREIGADEIPSASIFPSPTGIPSPAPTQNPGSTFQNAYCVFGVYNLLSTLNIASDTDIPCI